MSDQTVYVTATEEPFGRKDLTRVHVSVALAAYEAGAESRVKAFVKAMAQAEFLVCEVDQAAVTPIIAGGKALMLAPLSSPAPTPAVPAVPEKLLAWIDARLMKERGNWQSSRRSVDDEITPRVLTAEALIGGVKGWDAPLAGLTDLSVLREVETAAIDGKSWIAVPVFGVNTIAATAVTPTPTTDGAVEVGFVTTLGGGFDDVEVKARHEPLMPSFAKPLRDDGFYDLGDEEASLLRTVRANGGATLALPPELIGWSGNCKTQAGLEWRAGNAILMLLDPTITALTMGGTEREGPFVKIINAGLADDTPADVPARISKWINGQVNATFVTPSDPDRLIAAGRALGLIVGDPPAVADASSLLAAVALGRLLFDPAPPSLAVLRTAGDQIDAEISALLQRLEGEDGVEETVLRTMEIAGITDAALRGAFNLPAEVAPIAQVKARLASDYNGADAVRQATGSVIEQTLAAFDPATAAGPRPASSPSKTPIANAIRDANWFATRLGLADAASLRAWFQSLPPPIAGLSAGEATAALDWFAGRYAIAAADLLPAASGLLAAPAATPRPIVVRFGMGHDQVEADRHDDLFQGVGVLVRRALPDDQPWAHANLATLTLTDGSTVPIALHPMRPASEDGQRRLAIDYHGFPLASTRKQASADGQAVDPGRLAFAKHNDPSEIVLAAAKFTLLPALYYGATYQVAAFAVAASGSLPPPLRMSDAEPWSLKPDLGRGTMPGQIEAVCRRETAIGRVAIAAAAKPGERSPLDAAIPGVEPLYRAYPRLALAAPSGGRSWLDLGRARNGTGLLSPAQTVTLGRLLRWGKGKATFAVFDNPDHDTAPVRSGDVVGSDPEIVLPDADLEARFWIRLTLSADAAAPAGLSFADPSLSGDGGDAPGFVLLRPDEPPSPGKTAVFHDTLAGEVEATVHFPRMGFLDFDRWLSNPALRKDAGGDKTGTMLETLMTAFADGELEPDPTKKSPVTIEGLNHLPDLAVEGLQVTLTPIDTLAGDAGTEAPRVRLLPVPKLADASAGTARGILERIATLYQTKLEVSAASSLTLSPNDSAIKATLPPGTVARLQIRPVVAKRRFVDNVVSREIERLAVGEDGDFLVFDGPAIVLEGMAVPALPKRWPGAEPITIRPAGRERRYRIVAGGADVDDPGLWRKFGSVEVESQRWRYQGRPVNARLDPAKAVLPAPAGDPREWRVDFPAVPLAPNRADVATFEQALFGERDVADSQKRAVLLNPLPGETILVDMAWEPPSATYFRHALTLRSRYWGALVDPGTSGVLSKSLDRDRWWGRIAMLADRSRIDLTRPQLRALMPLTIDAAGGVGTPPVLALLSEPPYAQGGLADRVAAEIKTGFSYVIAEDAAAARHLQVHDSRKEAGPDPRLSYQAMSEEDAFALVLDAQGPIGLGFDDPTEAESAAYPNSAFVLTPRSGTRRLAEHFLSISMRRYLDHAWTLGEVPDPKRSTWPHNQAWWFDVALDDKPGELPELRCGDLKIAQIKPVAGSSGVSIWVDRNAVLKPSGSAILAPDLVEVARDLSGAGQSFAFLHQPLDGGRGALSVFRTGGGDAVMLASYEWSVEGEAPPPLTVRGRAEAPKPVSASTATAMNWTRTGVDADVLHFAGPATGGRRVPTPTRIGTHSNEAGVVRTTGGAALAVNGVEGWARPALAFAPEPLHVQRHLAVIGTRFLAPEAEEVVGVWLAPSRVLPIGANVDAVRMIEFELVAQPVCGGLESAPSRYKTAVFDLQSIGRANGRSRPDLLFFVRPLGGWGAGGASRTLSMTAGTRKLTIPLGKDPVASLLLLVRSGGPVEAIMIDDTGETGPPVSLAGPTQDNGPLEDDAKFKICDVAVGSGETWLEVAMLTLNAPDDFKTAIALPLDRFFSAEETIPTSPARAVLPDALASLAEAEARLISVSMRMTVS